MKKNTFGVNDNVLLPAAATDDFTVIPTVRMVFILIITFTFASSLNGHFRFFIKA